MRLIEVTYYYYYYLPSHDIILQILYKRLFLPNVSKLSNLYMIPASSRKSCVKQLVSYRKSSKNSFFCFRKVKNSEVQISVQFLRRTFLNNDRSYSPICLSSNVKPQLAVSCEQLLKQLGKISLPENRFTGSPH